MTGVQTCALPILLDEPTAAISIRQVAEILARIKQLKETGHAVILVSHRMQDVFEVCDRVVVLRRGYKIADKPILKTSREEVTGLITGALETRSEEHTSELQSRRNLVCRLLLEKNKFEY